MKQIIIFFFVFMGLQPIFAQKLLNVQHGCTWSGDKFSEEDIYGFEPSAEADKMVQRILEVVGLEKKNFTLQSANVANAEAVISENGQRMILYNSIWMSQLSEGNDWAATFVLAHEIGHHLQGHTLTDDGSRPETELQADEWAGFAMCKLGATLAQTISVFKNIAEKPKSTTHPPKSAREVAATNGYLKAKCRSNGEPETEPDTDGDGYVNSKDNCPDKYSKTNNGCPIQDNCYKWAVCSSCAGQKVLSSSRVCTKCNGSRKVGSNPNCGSCGGDGLVGGPWGDNSQKCLSCAGSVTCSQCNGQGQVTTQSTCMKCNGLGEVQVKVNCN